MQTHFGPFLFYRIYKDLNRKIDKNLKSYFFVLFFFYVRCGYATLHDVRDKSQEDRMESFFLSETCKYLYLLFDSENHVNQDASNYIFSTEGHIFRLDPRFRKSALESRTRKFSAKVAKAPPYTRSAGRYNDSVGCAMFCGNLNSPLPMDIHHWEAVEAAVGI